MSNDIPARLIGSVVAKDRNFFPSIRRKLRLNRGMSVHSDIVSEGLGLSKGLVARTSPSDIHCAFLLLSEPARVPRCAFSLSGELPLCQRQGKFAPRSS